MVSVSSAQCPRAAARTLFEPRAQDSPRASFAELDAAFVAADGISVGRGDHSLPGTASAGDGQGGGSTVPLLPGLVRRIGHEPRFDPDTRRPDRAPPAEARGP